MANFAKHKTYILYNCFDFQPLEFYFVSLAISKI